MSESGATLRIVVDTNVIVSGAISPIGAPRRLLDAWADQRFSVLLSDAQYDEVVGVFDRPRIVAQIRFTATELTQLFAGLATAVRVAPIPTIPVQVRDPKDVEILAAALGGAADYLVTGDADLLALRDDPLIGRLQIVTVVEFLETLGDS